jgi:hypothetical protein
MEVESVRTFLFLFSLSFPFFLLSNCRVFSLLSSSSSLFKISKKLQNKTQFSTGTFAGQAVAEGGVAPVGTPIAYIAETDADLEAAKAKAAGGGAAAAPAPVS